MKQYLELMLRVLEKGEQRKDRTGIGTLSLFGETLKFDLRHGFPAVTTKKLAFKQICAELTCFLRGYNTLEEFHSVGCKVWDGNATAKWWVAQCVMRGFPHGYLGPIYGVMWRYWWTPTGKVDQLHDAVLLLRKDPWTRRACITAWNPMIKENDVCLPPCHHFFQFSMRDRNRLDCIVHMRSVDVFLGMAFDIASYALLMHLVAQDVGRGREMVTPGILTMTFADTHIYLNHVDACREQTMRFTKLLPTLHLPTSAGIDSFEPDWAALDGYEFHPGIQAELNV